MYKIEIIMTNVVLSRLFKFGDLLENLNIVDEYLRFDQYLVNIIEGGAEIQDCYNWLLCQYNKNTIILVPEQLASKNAPILLEYIDQYLFVQKYRGLFRIVVSKVEISGSAYWYESGDVLFDEEWFFHKKSEHPYCVLSGSSGESTISDAIYFRDSKKFRTDMAFINAVRNNSTNGICSHFEKYFSQPNARPRCRSTYINHIKFKVVELKEGDYSYRIVSNGSTEEQIEYFEDIKWYGEDPRDDEYDTDFVIFPNNTIGRR